MEEKFNVIDYKSKAKNVACLIVGDIILDKYICGDVNRISQEAPVPILRVENEKYILGGAANVASNIKSFGLSSYLCGIVGTDHDGDVIVELLKDNDIHFIGVRLQHRRTTIKTRVMSLNQQLIRIDDEEYNDICKTEESILFDAIQNTLDRIQIVILSDYSKGICTEAICKRTISICNKRNIPVIVDPKSNSWEKYSNSMLITPNLKDIALADNRAITDDVDCAKSIAIELKSHYGIKNILITRGKRGMSFFNEDSEMFTYPAIAHEVCDVSGAGDTVVATIASICSAGYSLKTAVEISNYAASISIKKWGTSVVTIDETIKYIDMLNNESDYKKIFFVNEEMKILEDWKKNNQKIVFTNGCFDILHSGHIRLLNEAKKLGDKLVVGLNTDNSIKRTKGSSRPIINETDRALVLSALSSVDIIIMFDEDTPYELIKKMRPDILVKGSDYKENEVVGREFAQEVKLITRIDDCSTTNIIMKIRRIKC